MDRREHCRCRSSSSSSLVERASTRAHCPLRALYASTLAHPASRARLVSATAATSYIERKSIGSSTPSVRRRASKILLHPDVAEMDSFELKVSLSYNTHTPFGRVRHARWGQSIERDKVQSCGVCSSLSCRGGHEIYVHQSVSIESDLSRLERRNVAPIIVYARISADRCLARVDAQVEREK
ncbi:unnamed protein product [Trichogramma brassicae]|uniref:Uncharacterized protein n=1 Tax=Trichogramma brassicae TaxID=86971 RepID=A0A6H5HV61_9HYME|nr:unnamed protein product [Trichogramma brassicae]